MFVSSSWKGKTCYHITSLFLTGTRSVGSVQVSRVVSPTTASGHTSIQKSWVWLHRLLNWAFVAIWTNQSTKSPSIQSHICAHTGSRGFLAGVSRFLSRGVTIHTHGTALGEIWGLTNIYAGGWTIEPPKILTAQRLLYQLSHSAPTWCWARSRFQTLYVRRSSSLEAHRISIQWLMMMCLLSVKTCTFFFSTFWRGSISSDVQSCFDALE